MFTFFNMTVTMRTHSSIRNIWYINRLHTVHWTSICTQHLKIHLILLVGTEEILFVKLNAESYYGRQIGNRPQAFEWYQFE